LMSTAMDVLRRVSTSAVGGGGVEVCVLAEARSRRRTEAP
jgi:hypothetical protein